ncbi:MAG: alpha/beta hydrolase, partial [Alphaproteobacteria bacterium]|nr:alpha/beta hydrolase [Alphaproteobacteria bacterium]
MDRDLPIDIKAASNRDIEASGGHAFFIAGRGSAEVRVARWLPPHATRDIVVLGGRSEFIEKFLETIGELVARNFRVWTMDWQGHGLSRRALSDPLKCHIDRFETYLDGLDQFLRRFVDCPQPGRLLVLANSMGGHIALRYMHDRPNVFARAVLIAPMIDVWTGRYARPVARFLAASACWFGFGDRYIPGGGMWDRSALAFEGNRLTGDAVRFQDEALWIANNPALALGGPTFGWVNAMFHSIERCRTPSFARAIGIPVLMIAASDERVVRNDAQMRLA